jgi:hypothetical protein
MPNRLRISLKKEPAMTVSRVATGNLKLVYVICANFKIAYLRGRTPVVYIGTTENGVSRIATSAAYRAEQVFSMHGISSFDVRVVTCTPRQRVKSWRKLERALLLGFRIKYGEVPKCNVQGKGMRLTDEFDYFARARIRSILADLEAYGESRGRPVSG